MQSRKHSALETLANVFVGYIAAVLSQMMVYPVFRIEVAPGTHLAIGAWFTAISLIRSYAMRRLFNRYEDER
jgi:hypothetical protein